MFSNDLNCGGFALVIILAALTVYRRSFSRGYWDYQHDPIFFDRSDHGHVYEYRCHKEKLRYGRERIPFIIKGAEEE